MDNYIVPVIQRSQSGNNRCFDMEGVMENRGRAVFHNATELWAILAGTGQEANNDAKQPELQK